MTRDVGDLLRVLDLEQIERNIFRGQIPAYETRQRVFGGLVVAQALVAATRTVEGRAPHSLHCYFILPGDTAMPIVYEVERVRDGRSFTTRRCIAVQNGRTIFDLFASFQLEERGLEHQAPMPSVADPDTLPSGPEIEARFGHLMPAGLKSWFIGERAIEIRPCDLRRYDKRSPPQSVQQLWIRASERLPDDPAIHRAVLAYFSDMTLIDATLAPHGRTLFEPEFAAASLDHAIWFHRPFRADEWLLYSQDSPNMAGGRGLARGLIFDRAGQLVASVMQEGLIRMKSD
jgi:acyl-CoA thioesterase-2